MSEEKKKAKSRSRFGFFELTEGASRKIDEWNKQADAKKRGAKLSRKVLANWAIENAPANISNAELTRLIDLHYGNERLLRNLLRDVKLAKAKGGDLLDFELVLKPRKAAVRKDALTADGSVEELSDAGTTTTKGD